MNSQVLTALKRFASIYDPAESNGISQTHILRALLANLIPVPEYTNPEQNANWYKQWCEKIYELNKIVTDFSLDIPIEWQGIWPVCVEYVSKNK